MRALLPIAKALSAAAATTALVLSGLSPADAGRAQFDDREDDEIAGLAAGAATFRYTDRAATASVDFLYLAPDGGFDHYLYLRAQRRTWFSHRAEDGSVEFVYFAIHAGVMHTKRCSTTWEVAPATADTPAEVSVRIPTSCLRKGPSAHRSTPEEVTFCYKAVDFGTPDQYETVPGGNSVDGPGAACRTRPIHR